MRLLATAVLAVSALLPIACTAADKASYQEGTHYKPVREASAPSAAGKRIEVAEFFWYGCGHCYAFEPELEKWMARKPADVDFTRVPNSLGRPAGLVHSKAYYTADALGVSAKIHPALFRALNVEQQTLDTDDQMAAFFTRTTGILPDVVLGTMRGFAVDSRVRGAEGLARQYAIASTPTVVVDGRYQTNATLAKGFPEMLKVIDFLIAKTREDRKKK